MAFTEQSGLGSANNLGPLKAGALVAKSLFMGDRIINLNYDIEFDLALQQNRKFFTYAPNASRDSIVMHKAHGSFNLYESRELGRWGFCDPSQVQGSVSLRYDGGLWSPSSAILPPRLKKEHRQHPIAAHVLEELSAFEPRSSRLGESGSPPAMLTF